MSDVVDEKKIGLAYYTSLGVMVALILVAYVQWSVCGLRSQSVQNVRDISIDVLAMIIAGILNFSLINNRPWDKRNRSLYRLIFTLSGLFFFQFATCYTQGHAGYGKAVVVLYTLMYFNETLLLYCFWAYIREEIGRKGSIGINIANWVCQLMLFIDLIADIVNMKLGFYFSVDDGANLVSGPYENVAEITTFIIFILSWLMILMARERSLKEKLVLMTFQVFPLVAKIFSVSATDCAFELPSYLLATIVIYMNIFSMRSKKILEQELLLEEQRTTLMISQIQPHFLYNVLTTISNLCVTDPEEAEETTVLFSQYLRTNLDSLRQSAPVPFKAELGHIRTYVELEKKRFKDKLNVEIDCPEGDFLVPSLGLQPIVENSIKHGIRGKDSPGHLWITDRRVEGGYEVVIRDDGIGFDPSAPAPNDGRSHVGMTNVKSRLERMCHARVQVESSPGNGCKTTIFFPAQ